MSKIRELKEQLQERKGKDDSIRQKLFEKIKQENEELERVGKRIY